MVKQGDLSTTAAQAAARAAEVADAAPGPLPTPIAAFSTQAANGSPAGELRASLSLQQAEDASPAEVAWNGVLLGVPADPSPSPTTRPSWSAGSWDSQPLNLGGGPKSPQEIPTTSASVQVVEVPAGTVVASEPATEPTTPQRPATKSVAGLDIDMQLDSALSASTVLLAILVVALSGGLVWAMRRRGSQRRHRLR